MTDKPWSERIPAAIARGKEYVGKRRVRWIPEANDYITPGEVALAGACYEAHESLNTFGGEMWPTALRDFTEKMERSEP